LALIILFRWLSVVLVGLENVDCSNPTSTTDSHLKRIISTNCCIHTVVPPDDGHRYARYMSRLTKYTKNKLCIRLVFLYTTRRKYSCLYTSINIHGFMSQNTEIFQLQSYLRDLSGSLCRSTSSCRCGGWSR